MIIVDTNIIAYFYLEGTYSLQAEKLFSKDPVWAAPLLWRSEFRNVLAVYFRKKIITYRDVLEIMNQAEILLQGNEYPVSSEEILELVKDSNCSSYDCEFVALARKLKKPLITGDKKILSAFPNDTLSLIEFCNAS